MCTFCREDPSFEETAITGKPKLRGRDSACVVPRAGAAAVVQLWRCRSGSVAVAMLLWQHGRGGLAVAVWPWRCCCGGMAVAMLLWQCCCGGAAVAAWPWRCGCGDAAVPEAWSRRDVTGRGESPVTGRLLALGRSVNVRDVVCGYCLQVPSQLFLEVCACRLYPCSALFGKTDTQHFEFSKEFLCKRLPHSALFHRYLLLRFPS